MEPTAAAQRDGGVWDSAHRVLTLGLVLTVSMAAFENLAVATILPATVSEIGGLQFYGWAFSGFMLAEIVGISVAGRAGDARGLAPPFAVGGALFSAALLGAGSAGSMPALIACRVLQGLGAGAISTLAYVGVARGYAESARPRMLALLSTAWVVPGLIGPALAAGVHAYLGWRWVFLGLAPFSVVSVALAAQALRGLGPSGAAAAAGSDTAAATGLAAGVAVLLFALSLDHLSVTVAVGGLAAAIALPTFRHLTPPGTLRARPGLPAAVAVMALLSAAFFGAEVFVPLSLTDVRHRSVAFAGVALTAATVSWTSGAWLQARLAPRRSRRALIAAGLLLLAAGIAAIGGVLLPSIPAELAPLAWGVAGLGVGLAYSTTALVVLECAPAGEEGSASSAMQLANVLGTALGTGGGGAVLARVAARGGSTMSAIALTDALALCAAFAALALSVRLPGRRDLPSP
jgi:MFS family permease